MKALAIIGAAAVCAAPALGFAQAQETGFYVGGSVGQAQAKDWCSGDLPAGFTATGCDDKATAWKIFAGYRFGQNFAVEGTFLKTDDFSASVSFGGTTAAVKGDLQGFGIAGVGILPLGQQFSLFGKLGVMRTEAEGSVTLGGTALNAGENATEAHFGLGAAFNFSRNLGIRAEWERLEKNKIDMLSIGVQYKF